jgi:hypothetical protein
LGLERGSLTASNQGKVGVLPEGPSNGIDSGSVTCSKTSMDLLPSITELKSILQAHAKISVKQPQQNRIENDIKNFPKPSSLRMFTRNPHGSIGGLR